MNVIVMTTDKGVVGPRVINWAKSSVKLAVRISSSAAAITSNRVGKLVIFAVSLLVCLIVGAPFANPGPGNFSIAAFAIAIIAGLTVPVTVAIIPMVMIIIIIVTSLDS